MDEVMRSVASNDGGFIHWRHRLSDDPFERHALRMALHEIDNYIMSRPGYRVTVTVEREPGLHVPDTADELLTGAADH
jgi:hypothetical protein